MVKIKMIEIKPYRLLGCGTLLTTHTQSKQTFYLCLSTHTHTHIHTFKNNSKKHIFWIMRFLLYSFLSRF